MTNLSHYFSGTSLSLFLTLFPLTYILHIADEYWSGDGYSVYLFKNYGVELLPARFLALQSLGLTLMTVGILLAQTLRFSKMMLAILGTVIFCNGLLHVTRSFVTRRYEPGLTTSLTLWLPLGIVSLLASWNSQTVLRFGLAALTGATITVVVEVITMRGGKLRREFR